MNTNFKKPPDTQQIQFPMAFESPVEAFNRLTRKSSGSVNAASLCDVGGIFEVASQGGYGIQSQVVVSDIAAPEDLRFYPLGPRRLRSRSLVRSSSFGSSAKMFSSSETIRWNLCIRDGYDSMKLIHWEALHFLVVEAVRCYRHFAVSFYLEQVNHSQSWLGNGIEPYLAGDNAVEVSGYGDYAA